MVILPGFAWNQFAENKSFIDMIYLSIETLSHPYSKIRKTKQYQNQANSLTNKAKYAVTRWNGKMR